MEVAFYALAPFILKNNKLITLYAIIGFTLRLIPHGYHFPVFVGLDCFCIGALSYRYRFLYEKLAFNHNKIYKIGILLLILFLVTCAIPHVSLVPYKNAKLGSDDFFYPLLFAIFIPIIFKVTKDSSIDRFIGNLSYPFYIFHEMVIIFLINIKSHIEGFYLSITAIVATLIISLLFVKFESAIIEPMRAKYSDPKP